MPHFYIHPQLPEKPRHVFSLEGVAENANILVVYNCETWGREHFGNLEYTVARFGAGFKICRLENDGIIYEQDVRPSISDLEKIFSGLSTLRAESSLPLAMRILALRMCVDVSEDIIQMRADMTDRTPAETSIAS